MILKIASPALTLASFLGTVLVAPSASHQIAKSVNFAKDPTDAAPHGLDGEALQTKDRNVQSRNCSRFERPVMQTLVSLINLDVEQEHDLDKMLSVESHRQLEGIVSNGPGPDGIQCYYSDSSKGVRCYGYMACYDYDQWRINPDDVECGSCNGEKACYSVSFRNITVGEKSCSGKYSCALLIGEYEEETKEVEHFILLLLTYHLCFVNFRSSQHWGQCMVRPQHYPSLALPLEQTIA
jgi:hypothetical protein